MVSTGVNSSTQMYIIRTSTLVAPNGGLDYRFKVQSLLENVLRPALGWHGCDIFFLGAMITPSPANE